MNNKSSFFVKQKLKLRDAFSGFWSQKVEQIVVGYAFLLPDVIGLFVFLVLPMLYVGYLSFQEWSTLSTVEFVGIENYLHIFEDKLWWQALLTTFKYLVLYVPIVVGLALLLATILNSKIKFPTFFRMVFFSPYVVSLVVAGVIWTYMFSLKGGVVNEGLSFFGFEPVEWLSSMDWALPSVMIVSVWKYMGFYMVIFIAGLQEIPKVYYEAAKMDGATPLQQFRYITLPLLKPVTFFVVTIAMIAGFRAFDQVYVMTRGGPYYATYLVMFYIYEKAFTHFDYGYASALSSIFFLIIFAVTYIQMRYTQPEPLA